jgi:hypothetical protein
MKNLEKILNKQIQSASFNDELVLTFTDGTRAAFQDNGQCCCEERYQTCDDDVSILNGTTLLSVDVSHADGEEDDDVVHECAFVRVQSDKGFVTICNHNKHNGYYDGFNLVIRIQGK